MNSNKEIKVSFFKDGKALLRRELFRGAPIIYEKEGLPVNSDTLNVDAYVLFDVGVSGIVNRIETMYLDAKSRKAMTVADNALAIRLDMSNKDEIQKEVEVKLDKHEGNIVVSFYDKPVLMRTNIGNGLFALTNHDVLCGLEFCNVY